METLKHKDAFLRLVCCDCGLTHDIDMEVKGDEIQLEFERNNRATGQNRRRFTEQGHKLGTVNRRKLNQ